MAEAAEVGGASRKIMSEASRWMDRGLGWEKDSVSEELAKEARKLGGRMEKQVKRQAENTASLEGCERGLKGCMCHILSGMSERASPTADLPA